jgi:hypothetical protein
MVSLQSFTMILESKQLNDLNSVTSSPVPVVCLIIDPFARQSAVYRLVLQLNV